MQMIDLHYKQYNKKKCYKKRKFAAQKKADREAKKAQVTAKALASQVNKNPLGGVQKSRIYN